MKLKAVSHIYLICSIEFSFDIVWIVYGTIHDVQSQLELV